MSVSPDLKKRLKENAEDAESSSLDRVLERNRMAQVRQEIGIIADRSLGQNLISEEAYEGYRELAEGREQDELSAEMLESTRKFAKEHEEKAVRVHQKILAGIRAGYASETDEEFLMEQLITENIDFVARAGEVEKLIDDKLARMKKDRERYDKLAAHPLIKEEGELKIDENTSIEFPDAKEFLELSVPERRELLKQLEEALPKAEKYAEEHEGDEEEELTDEYTEKLDEAMEEGIIGQHTYDAFLNEFKKQDLKEKKRWNSQAEFKGQMKRYEVLWDQIREELRGEALAGIEAQIDKKGYSELLAEFGRLKQSESQRLKTGYSAALEGYRQQGVIGRHTLSEFKNWMDGQNLEAQYEAEEELPEQMERYERFWEEVESEESGLSEKQQAFLRSKIDVWGYTELRHQFSEFKNGTDTYGEEDPLDRKSLSQLRSREVKEAIVEAEEMLSEGGESKKKGFMATLDKMFSRVNRDSFDATSFEAEVHKKAVAANPAVKREAKGRGADDEVDFEAIGMDTEVLEDMEASKVTDELGFIQVESEGHEGAERQVQLTINEEEGLEHFFEERAKRDFAEKKDDISLAIWSDTGRTVEMDLQEVRALRNYLKESEEEETEKAA